MNASYKDIKAQIEDLKRQAEEARMNEIDEIIDQIKQEIREYDLSADDLGFHLNTESKPVVRARQRSEAKYRGPTGDTWTGRGRKPRWMEQAIAEGHSMDEFLI